MGLLFVLFKIFPAFGVSLAFVFFDFARNAKRKGSKAWIGFMTLAALMVASSAAWVIYRGDLHAEEWFSRLVKTLWER
jgi:hypothetical protein